MPTLHRFPSLILSLLGNLFLAWLFLKAILSPEENAFFILKIGVAIFVIEFLTVHSGAMLAERDRSGWRAIPRNFFLIGLYSVFALAAGYTAKNWLLPIVFFISLISKVIGPKTSGNKIVIPTLLLLGCMGIAMFLAQWIQSHSPLPQDIYDAVLERSSGMDDKPLVFIVWGVLYYFLSAVMEVVLFFRQKHPPSNLRV